ncbi:hypothetical protein D0Z07_2656 [Hyphodiscus hymeniophilus]|uniref:2EXR domain-containing protein n=1 Tax=Hyphodiscus hymeniophilus TaxID=353542 RepID=A0A9P6VLQ7_9HELO|nr:hypothetical protein D0Z07_2656 [Hyphodiscus hymeniophilus]
MSNFKATAFTLFPELPSELRFKIWQLCIPGPRVVPIEYKMKSETFNGKMISKFSGWGTQDPVPVILHICHESRIEALKSLQPAFRSYFQEPKVYINFDIDTILFGVHIDAPLQAESFFDNKPRDYLLDIFLGGEYHGADDAEKIQSMVLDLPKSLYGRRAFCWDEIRLFENLKKLTIRAWDDDDASERLMARFRGTLRNVAGKHPEWDVPVITAMSASSGNDWGKVEVHIQQLVE